MPPPLPVTVADTLYIDAYIYTADDKTFLCWSSVGTSFHILHKAWDRSTRRDSADASVLTHNGENSISAFA